MRHTHSKTEVKVTCSAQFVGRIVSTLAEEIEQGMMFDASYADGVVTLKVLNSDGSNADVIASIHREIAKIDGIVGWDDQVDEDGDEWEIKLIDGKVVI